jgi:hypothetical protein
LYLILLIKFSGDRTNLSRNVKVINLTITLINEGQKAKTASGNYLVGVFSIRNEDYETLRNCLTEFAEE